MKINLAVPHARGSSTFPFLYKCLYNGSVFNVFLFVTLQLQLYRGSSKISPLNNPSYSHQEHLPCQDFEAKIMVCLVPLVMEFISRPKPREHCHLYLQKPSHHQPWPAPSSSFHPRWMPSLVPRRRPLARALCACWRKTLLFSSPS